MSCTLSAEAREDVAAGIRFYNSRPGRYGTAFRREVESAMARVAENPRLYPPAEDGVEGIEVREFFIARFDQRVIYLVTGDDVLVVAVFHASRREGAWHRRLPPTPPEAT